MKIKFKTFSPCKAYWYTAADMLNKWLKENTSAEIISWQTTPVGTTNEIYITIQYKEN